MTCTAKRETKPQAELTIGTACFDDAEGVVWSVQSLRLMHSQELKRCSLLVIDNNPHAKDGAGKVLLDGKGKPVPSPHGQAVRDFLGWCQGDFASVQYVPYTEATGTSAPRDHIFRIATTPAVLCMDSHVILFPGSVKRLLDYYRANPNTGDVLSGPMIYDDLRSGPTHMADEWRAEMWGTWADAWQCKCGGFLFEAFEDVTGGAPTTPVYFAGYRTLTPPQQRVTACPKCGSLLPTLPWYGHQQGLRQAGCKLAVEATNQPFEIPAMGLGLFSCRRDAWLGFNPRFRSFGGEEWYIHEKYRQAGHKALCLPWLKWWHRFIRIGGPRYPLNRQDKVRNYIIGLQELGLPLDRCHAHFVGGVGLQPGGLPMPQSMWDGLVAEAEGRATPVAQSQATSFAPHSVQVAAMPQASQQQQSQPAGGCKEQEAKGQKSPCQQKREENEAAAQAEAARRNTAGDIFAALKDLAAGAGHVTELGQRAGATTLALLESKPALLLSHYQTADEVRLKAPGGSTWDHASYSGDVAGPTEPTDLLVLDIRQTERHLTEALDTLAGQVSGRIAVRWTQAYGEDGEDGGPGLLVGLRKFLRSHPEWTVKDHLTVAGGLTVLTRLAEDKPALPNVARKGWNFAKALGRMALAKVQGHELLVDAATAEARLDVCSTCPQRNGNSCSVCGCYLEETPAGTPGKALLTVESCPLSKWSEVEAAS